MDRLSSHYFKSPTSSNPQLGSSSTNPSGPAQQHPTPGGDKEDFIWHTVLPRDTILGLSLKYGVSAQTILMANDLPSSGNANLSLLPRLKIPHGRRLVVEPDGEASQRALLREFRTRHSLPEAEAKYYLLEGEWDLARAGEILNEHLRFEAGAGGYPGDGKAAKGGGSACSAAASTTGVRGLSSGSSSFTTAALKLSTTRGEGGGGGGGGGAAPPSSRLVVEEDGGKEGGGGEEEDEESSPLVKPTFPGLLRRRKGEGNS